MRLMRVCRIPVFVLVLGVVVLHVSIIVLESPFNDPSYWIFLFCCLLFITMQLVIVIRSWPLMKLPHFKKSESLDAYMLNESGAMNSRVVSFKVPMKIIAVVCGLCCLAVTSITCFATYFVLTFDFDENPTPRSEIILASLLCIAIALIGIPAAIFNFAALALKVVRHEPATQN